MPVVKASGLKPCALTLPRTEPRITSVGGTALQEKKWAEQAYVFPAWEQYQAAVQQRASEAGRQWMPSAAASQQ